MSETSLIKREDIAPSFVVSAEEISERIAELQAFVANYLKEGEDYGTIPGTPKPTLFKPGAEKLCDVYGFQRRFEVTSRVENWDKPLFNYEVRADLVSLRTGLLIAQGFGSANSMEARYRWRDAQRICPDCEQAAIIKGKAEYGGGWVCFKKKGGCGAKFAGNDVQVTGQPVGRVENDDIYTLVNTLLKMAKKRALVDAVLSATRSSGIFTQDIEDFVEGESRVVEEKPPAKPKGGQKVIANQAAVYGYLKESGMSLKDAVVKLGADPAIIESREDADEFLGLHVRDLKEFQSLSDEEAWGGVLEAVKA